MIAMVLGAFVGTFLIVHLTPKSDGENLVSEKAWRQKVGEITESVEAIGRP